MLTDKPNSKKRQIKSRKPTAVNKWYSDSQKLDAVKLWLTTGNLMATAAALNIKYTTMREWRYTNWWAELAEQIRTEGTMKMTNRLKVAAEKALEVTIDRLENGDWFYDQKTGEVRRKPVTLRDANTATSMLLDKAIKLEQRPIEDADKHKVQDRLDALAKAFGEFASKARRVEVIDAVYDQRREASLLPGSESEVVLEEGGETLETESVGEFSGDSGGEIPIEGEGPAQEN